MIKKYNDYCKEMKEKGKEPLSYGYWVARFDPYKKEREEREAKEYIARRKKERETEELNKKLAKKGKEIDVDILNKLDIIAEYRNGLSEAHLRLNELYYSE